MADQNFRVKRGLEVGLGATVLTALPSGFVGIGTTNPTYKVQIDDTAATGAGLLVRGGALGGTLARFERNIGGTGIVEINASGSSPQMVFSGTGATTFTFGLNAASSFNAFEIANATALGTNTRFLINSSGNTGIGTTTPGARLHVVPTSTNIAGLFSGSTSDDMIRITQLGTGNALRVEDSANPDSSPFVITGSGDVGIGTINPSSKLAVEGAITVTNPDASALAVRSGSATSYTDISIGRISGESRISVPASSGQFINDSSAGDLTVRSNATSKILFTNGVTNSTLAIAGNNVLVGTVSSTGTASQALQVNSGAYISGNLGIGTTNPLDKLHVLGDFLVAAGNSTGQHITQKAYELNNGTMSWEGSAGQLFSITNNLTSGSIFSVNDVSGIPSIDVDANGTIALAPYGTTENVGVGTTSPTSKLTVEGNALITGILTATTGLGGDAFESYEIDLVPYTSYNLRTVATTITFDDSNTTDAALYGTIVELPIEDNDFIEDSTYIPYFDGEVVSITNPFKLMITVNGVLQSAFINNTDNVYQSNFLGSRNGYTIDSDNNIKFTESVPTGSDIVARVLPVSSAATKIKNYPFKPTDIVLGY